MVTSLRDRCVVFISPLRERHVVYFRFHNTEIKQRDVKPALISIFFSHPRTGVPVLTPRGCLSSHCASISLDNAMPSIVLPH